MYIDRAKFCSSKGKVYHRILLRTSYRENGKVKHRTIANLSSFTKQELEALEFALKHKQDIDQFKQGDIFTQGKQGPSIGALIVLKSLAQELGITKVLGQDKQGQLALWQVIARVLGQGSRLSATRIARDSGAVAVFDLPKFDEDDLYENLAWLEQQQGRIERELFNNRSEATSSKPLFLYDVTSTYLEGQQNELAAFGYNRDQKKGKKQIVLGLLCDNQGRPVAIEAFSGNTADTSTVASQLHKLSERFGGGPLTLVGDRGMIKTPQAQAINQEGFHYITAINKPQIESLLNQGVLQMELFEQDLAEVIPNENSKKKIRYILRRNPVRANEIAQNRQDKKMAVEQALEQANHYLKTHPKACVAKAKIKIEKKITSLKLSGWLEVVQSNERSLDLHANQEALLQESKLDGCYAICTDLPRQEADKHIVHQSYKSLSQVEAAFRTCKTIELEMRPVFVRKSSSTRGHLLVLMLSYLLTQELAKRWAGFDMTVQEALDLLKTYCAVELSGKIQILLQPSDQVAKLLSAANVTLPKNLIQKTNHVTTKNKLQKHRPRRSK